MFKALPHAIVLSAALVGTGAFAQSAGGADNPTIPSAPAVQPDKDPARATNPAAITFVKTQDITQWRAPKLVGVAVYGPDDKQIGKVSDVLIDHNGAAQTIVIGVGGFLGFGTKDVAVPFAAIQWRTEPRKVPVTDQPNPAASATGGPPAMKETDPAATEASQGYPDKAILGVTLSELKSAPDFKYASSQLAESDMRSTGGNESRQKTTP